MCIFTIFQLLVPDGSLVKYTFPMAFTVTNLAWGMLEFPLGYTVAGETGNMQDSLKWGLDYLLKCKLSDTEVVAMVIYIIFVISLHYIYF